MNLLEIYAGNTNPAIDVNLGFFLNTPTPSLLNPPPVVFPSIVTILPLLVTSATSPI